MGVCLAYPVRLVDFPSYHFSPITCKREWLKGMRKHDSRSQNSNDGLPIQDTSLTALSGDRSLPYCPLAPTLFNSSISNTLFPSSQGPLREELSLGQEDTQDFRTLTGRTAALNTAGASQSLSAYTSPTPQSPFYFMGERPFISDDCVVDYMPIRKDWVQVGMLNMWSG
jgi:hypothetical protein